MGIVNDFKEVLHKGMIDNFKNDGYLTPIVFFIKDNTPVIFPIPPEFINTVESKSHLAKLIREMCRKPSVIGAGIIIEAFGAKIEDQKLITQVMDGDVKIKDLNIKKDIILLQFSSPEGDELIAYVVDPENKKVCERFADEDVKQFEGMFSGFFNWNKN